MQWFLFFVLVILIASGMRAMKVAGTVLRQKQGEQAPPAAPDVEADRASSSQHSSIKSAQDTEKCSVCGAYVVPAAGACMRVQCPFGEGEG